MLSTQERAKEIMHHLVTHDGDGGHGYTWGNRWGNGVPEIITLSDGSQVTIAGGDRDCSSAVIDAWQSAGVDCGGATYTGNMVPCMVGTGNFEVKPLSFIAKPGDMYLNKANHVAMCLQQVPDQLMEFSINEFGEVYGGKLGDQTSRESHIGSYYNYPWDCILHYKGIAGEKIPTPVPTPQQGTPDIAYRVHTAESGWLPEVVNDADYAGVVGQGITYLAIKMSGWYQACTKKSGWLEPVGGYDINDLEYGCAGDGSPIIAVRCYYETQHPDVTGWLAIKYEVADIGNELFWPSMIDTDLQEDEDFAGNMMPIDRFRARLVKV